MDKIIKPRLRPMKSSLPYEETKFWHCEYPEGVGTLGTSPEDAYKKWQSLHSRMVAKGGHRDNYRIISKSSSMLLLPS